MHEKLHAATGAATGADPVAVTEQALDELLTRFSPEACDLAIVSIGATHAVAAEQIAARVRERLGPAHLLGTTAEAVVHDDRELEDPSGIVLWAARLPGVELTPLRYGPPRSGTALGEIQEEPSLGAWSEPPDAAAGLLVFADPASFPADAFLAWLAQVRPGLPAAGGLASGARGPGESRLLLDGEIFDSGAVALAFSGPVRLRTLVSQGCRPVGQSYVVTRAERNLIEELAGAPPVERVKEIYTEASPDDQARMRAGLHVGLVIDEYREAFGPGDFLVRGVLGADEESGALGVGDVVRVGQTVQFQVRDADSADEDLRRLLEPFGAQSRPAAALLFTCNGRGSRLFGRPDHDARLVRRWLGDVPLAGFFCAGEIGPVGDRPFLHGFTASLLTFEDSPS